MRIIRVPAGIGDNIWLAQKLINANEKFDFQLVGSKPQRGKQIFDLLPQITNTAVYESNLTYKQVEASSKYIKDSAWSTITDKAFSLQCNQHLEAGKRIEDFLPDLPITYQLPYVTDGSPPILTPTPMKLNPAIGIYCSAYSTARAWGFWNENEWFDFIQKIHAEIPGAVFYIIGAAFDIDLSGKLINKLRTNDVAVMDTLGKPLRYVIELMKTLNYFIGFPSGLPILNETLHKRTFMFYPPHLKKMMYTWAEESRIKSHDYLACLFCTPMEAFDTIGRYTNFKFLTT